MLRSGRQLKNHALEAELFRRRALVGFLGVLLALGGLAAWYFRLQVVQHAEYATRSEANRVRLVPVVPARGLILDRKGRILADNVSAWRLDAVPERAGDGAALLELASGLQPLLRTVAVQFRTRQCSLRGQHHRLRRCPGLQADPRRRQGALALADIELGDLALLLRRHQRQVTTGDFGQQVEAAGFAFDRERIDAAVRQYPPCVELATALKNRGQAQCQFGGLHGIVTTGSKTVVHINTSN